MIRRRRLRLGGPGSVPVVLPRVVARPQHAGTVTITVDGGPVSDGPIPRVQLGEAISQIVEQIGTAVRVEIHDPNGTVHADILTPPADQLGPTRTRRDRRSAGEHAPSDITPLREPA